MPETKFCVPCHLKSDALHAMATNAGISWSSVLAAIEQVGIPLVQAALEALLGSLISPAPVPPTPTPVAEG
jgi:hypothetical protein